MGKFQAPTSPYYMCYDYAFYDASRPQVALVLPLLSGQLYLASAAYLIQARHRHSEVLFKLWLANMLNKASAL